MRPTKWRRSGLSSPGRRPEDEAENGPGGGKKNRPDDRLLLSSSPELLSVPDSLSAQAIREAREILFAGVVVVVLAAVVMQSVCAEVKDGVELLEK